MIEIRRHTSVLLKKSPPIEGVKRFANSFYQNCSLDYYAFKYFVLLSINLQNGFENQGINYPSIALLRFK